MHVCLFLLFKKNNTRLMDFNIIVGENDRIFQELIEQYNILISIFK